ncbi:hypothetical protein B0A48_03106 [Cryoendolithus antarcticus]|uniref:RING-type E3 ubiquitin transferase n=1 Tax=Cryoendolithus antarcticus TaxID=1507870 RepID=A0A1V8TMD1_9PEZI|nr:hypothetical protein B0A48_03106 [Cryoendolithus antarcticus]
MRIRLYASASTALAAACLLKAFHQRPNFYSATVYLSQSNACLLILTNLLLVLASSFLYALQRLLYGPLRPIEIEQLSEKAWYAVLDTLLAMPSFREDVGGWLLVLFVLLLAGKVWGWIGEGRVDVLEQQPPQNPRLFHARLASSLIVSVLFNGGMGWYCASTVLADPRPGMMVIFTFEFAIQLIFAIFTLLRYALAVFEIGVVKAQVKQAIEERKMEIRAERAAARQNETAEGRPAPASAVDEEPIEVDENEVDTPGWEDKRRYLFVLEVITDFLKLVIYIAFFAVSVTFNGLPMHIMRDVYMTFASFSKRINDYINYRKATSEMNTRYPDATTEEIRGDACIVCREDMVAWEQPAANAGPQVPGQPAAPAPPAARRDEGIRAKKLPCGHILHLRCLKAWLERQQVCPTCRRPVVPPTPAGARGQAVVAQGANPAAPGQQPGQPPNAPRVRARFFNLGPVRIGFANGAPAQINDLVNQWRNPQGQANAAAPANANDGPNHLGLGVPYVAETAATRPATGLRAPIPMHVHLQQIEQRIMGEAQNLQIDVAQLATLRAMEAELIRLRTLRVPASLFTPGMTPQMPAGQETLHGSTARQMGTSHEGLPEGMVLPAGWTVMPLQRTGTLPGVSGQMVGGQGPTFVSAPAGFVPLGGAVPTPTIPQEATTATSAQGAVRPSAVPNLGPTDDQGSPLFVATPVAQESTLTSQVHETPAPEVASPTSQASEEASASASANPWASGNWSFNDAASGTPDTTTATSENAAATEDQSTTEPWPDKGKGRAVELEEVKDSEA